MRKGYLIQSGSSRLINRISKGSVEACACGRKVYAFLLKSLRAVVMMVRGQVDEGKAPGETGKGK